MQHSILITQCLQNDFVKPIGKYDQLPNLLHIGYTESKRLMGHSTTGGPVELFMQWAGATKEDELEIIHIRDWHNASDSNQHQHLHQFGEHCIANTPGAEFAFKLTDNRKSHIIHSKGLNDFVDTELDSLLEKHSNKNTRIGIIGVWTEAKVMFLAYDIISRYPHIKVAVCSALTASSSIHHHHTALDRLKRILGVRVIDSIGEFSQFLQNTKAEFMLPLANNETFPQLQFSGDINASKTDNEIIRYLFKSSKQVEMKVLDGGFSGNLVLATQSTDLEGRREVPHVLKIGNMKDIAKERISFEQVESVLGNNAPRISAYIDYKNRGGIKYRYAAMGSGDSKSFQKHFMSGTDLNEIFRFLDTIFDEQLGRMYVGKTFEQTNLLNYYWFHPTRAGQVRNWVEKAYCNKANAALLHLPTGHEFPNVCLFYENDVEELLPKASGSAFFSHIHGDLNGANIIVDSHKNIWIIDFSHSHRGHILKDLLKLENDLLYIFTQLDTEKDLEEALTISHILFKVTDLSAGLPHVDETGLRQPKFIRTYKTLQKLRSFYPNLIEFDRNPLQVFIGLLRYSLHTLIFHESNQLQKLWALYNSGFYGQIIKKQMNENGPLRVDWLKADAIKNGKLGITILPGRKDYSRSLDEDIKQLKDYGISKIVVLITFDEMHEYGVDKLLDIYASNDIETKHFPILDQKTPSLDDVIKVVSLIEQWLQDGNKVLIHCVGGLGRSGLVAACYLKAIGCTTRQAFDIVRGSRSSRAIESEAQEQFVREYGT